MHWDCSFRVSWSTGRNAAFAQPPAAGVTGLHGLRQERHPLNSSGSSGARRRRVCYVDSLKDRQPYTAQGYTSE